MYYVLIHEIIYVKYFFKTFLKIGCLVCKLLSADQGLF
jgi:hypothetical protein